MSVSQFFQHPQALVETNTIGRGTRVWAFAHILPGARIGEDCNICDGVFVEGKVIIGDRVTVKCGVQLWDGVVLEDDVFVGPNATFTNDRFPRSRQYPEEYLKTTVAQGASIGANATILPGVSIGRRAMVGAGAVVTKDVPAGALVIGSPARVVRFIDESGAENEGQSTGHETNFSGISLHRAASSCDTAATTVAARFRDLSAKPAGYEVFSPARNLELRREFALRCRQFVSCLHGECIVQVDDGVRRKDFRLNTPELILEVPPLLWCNQSGFSEDAILLTLFDPERDELPILVYRTFLATVGKGQRSDSGS